MAMTVTENQIELDLLAKLGDLKYTYHPDIRDRTALEARLRLYYDDFAKVVLRCPSFPEQNRIADCLMSVDNLITAQSQKIDGLKTHKKGLMQQLFPVSDEAPG